MKTSAIRNSHGYTVLEAIIAILIGALAITAMAFVLGHGFRLASDNRSHLYAVNSLREEEEVIRRLTFDTILGLGNSSTFTNTQLGKLQSGSGTRTIVNGFGADHKKVTLTVSWAERSGRVVSESLTTDVTRIGINRA